jgi:hypothetical protein
MLPDKRLGPLACDDGLSEGSAFLLMFAQTCYDCICSALLVSIYIWAVSGVAMLILRKHYISKTHVSGALSTKPVIIILLTT